MTGSHHRVRHSLQTRRAKLAGRVDDEAVRHELRELDAALHRLEQGSWGRCERCGGAIGRDRLRAIPEARWCLGCYQH